jgi:biopolymer transport protein ExbB
MLKISFLYLTLLGLALAMFSGVVSANIKLEDAYKREYIFLKTQLKQLKQQKLEVKKNYDLAESKAKEQIAKLQEKVIVVNSRNEVLNEKSYRLEQNFEMNTENKVILDNTLKQAEIFLNYKEKESKITFDKAFAAAFDKLNENSTQRNLEKEFFLDNGKKVKGNIAYIGNIASFGFHNEKSFVMAPAGNGELKVWKEISLNQDLSNMDSVISFFLYEKIDLAATKKQKQTVIDFVKAGGTIGWVIVIMGFVALFLCMIRAYNLRKYNKATDLLSSRQEESENTEILESSLAKLLTKVVSEKEQNSTRLDDVIDEGMINEHKSIDKFGSLILVFAAIAPLMGLLGTVTGMISTFDIITEYGTGDPKLLSQGISEALITTELGLIVAIPSLLFGNILSGWGKNLKMNVDQLVLKKVNDI